MAAKLQHTVRAQVLTRVEGKEGVNILPANGVTNSNDRRIAHFRDLAKKVFNFSRGHRLTVALDEIVSPIDEEEPSIGVNVSPVTGVIPPIDDGLISRIGALPVPLHERDSHLAPNADLTIAPLRYFCSGFITNLELIVRTNLSHRRPAPLPHGRIGNNSNQGLGRAIVIE